MLNLEKKVAVVFGAGAALGAASARLLDRQGYRVVLVARDEERLGKMAAELSVEAVPADLSDTAAVPALIDRIRERTGRIDLVQYAPAPSMTLGPAIGLDAATLQHSLNLFLLTPVEIVRAVLPEMIDRGDGAFLVAQGVSALQPVPGLAGVGAAMAATRNWLHSLHGEAATGGVHVGVVHVGAMVLGSAVHTAMLGGGLLPPGVDVDSLPGVDPADIAETLWQLYATGDRFEAQMP